MAYDFYKELFWDGMYGHMWDYAYDSVLRLNKMASILGQEEDTVHWNQTVGCKSKTNNPAKMVSFGHCPNCLPPSNSGNFYNFLPTSDAFE